MLGFKGKRFSLPIYLAACARYVPLESITGIKLQAGFCSQALKCATRSMINDLGRIL